jgi:S-adenosylmethionine:tRNA ribosyltransferase-isomerase
MKVEDFNYNLPEELIAQTPLEKRSNSKMLVLDRKTGKIEHRHFYDIIDYLNSGDLLVLNNTKVMASRLYGHKVDTNALIEILILKEIKKDIFECLVKPARRIKSGTIINFNDVMTANVINKFDEGICHLEFHYEGIFLERLDELGEMPLPPYIHEKLDDKDRYQTVYAKTVGSAAAPTAGLHFTPEILETLKTKGVEIEYITLHVGLGTFRPVTIEEVTEHHMHSEEYSVDEKTAVNLNNAIKNNKRIISVGTTTTRTLESMYRKYNKFVATNESTDIFIYPGYEFKVIDALITNFHLPKSTLVMLVSAFSKREFILNAYEEAVNNKYRFFSFGDAMFIK